MLASLAHVKSTHGVLHRGNAGILIKWCNTVLTLQSTWSKVSSLMFHPVRVHIYLVCCWIVHQCYGPLSWLWYLPIIQHTSLDRAILTFITSFQFPSLWSIRFALGHQFFKLYWSILWQTDIVSVDVALILGFRDFCYVYIVIWWISFSEHFQHIKDSREYHVWLSLRKKIMIYSWKLAETHLSSDVFWH